MIKSLNKERKQVCVNEMDKVKSVKIQDFISKKTNEFFVINKIPAEFFKKTPLCGLKIPVI